MKDETLISVVEEMLKNMKAGNSNINEELQLEIIDVIQKITSPELSKTESYNYIGVCRATFDNYVNKGLLPKGKKRLGSGLFWKKVDLDNFLRLSRKNPN